MAGKKGAAATATTDAPVLTEEQKKAANAARLADAREAQKKFVTDTETAAKARGLVAQVTAMQVGTDADPGTEILVNRALQAISDAQIAVDAANDHWTKKVVKLATYIRQKAFGVPSKAAKTPEMVSVEKQLSDAAKALLKAKTALATVADKKVMGKVNLQVRKAAEEYQEELASDVVPESQTA